MVWAGITTLEKTALVIMTRDFEAPSNGYTARSYIWALEEGLLPIYRPGDIFQQDNARIHVAISTQEWLQNHGIWVIDWPPHSPDLNPIEHVWKALKKNLYEIFPNTDSLRNNEADITELEQQLQTAWRAIDQDLVRRLVESIPRRLRACRRANGWYTKY
jgi:transposase